MIGRFYFLSLILVFFACNNGEAELIDTEGSEVDSLTISTDTDVMEQVEVEAKSDVEEATKEIEQKYGEQWDFCACIVVQDSIDKAFQKDLSDADMDQLIERSDFVDNKCKTLLIQPNSTPEEREKHEKKVRNCLRNAKKK